VEAERHWLVSLDGDRFEVEILEDAAPARLRVDGRALELMLDWQPGRPLAEVRPAAAARGFAFRIEPISEGFLLAHGGREMRALVRTHLAAQYAARMPERRPADRSRFLTAPMPGLVLSVSVQPGDAVKAGQELVVLEAMKMENVLRAERDGVVAEVRVAPRDTVNTDEVLITFR